jgi:hypothetical protein
MARKTQNEIRNKEVRQLFYQKHKKEKLKVSLVK